MPKNRKLESVGILVVTLGITAFVGVQVVAGLTSPEMQEYMEQSQEWCEDRNGELVNVMAVIGGGLHCDLPDGTTVHMGNVVEVNAEILEGEA